MKHSSSKIIIIIELIIIIFASLIYNNRLYKNILNLKENLNEQISICKNDNTIFEERKEYCEAIIKNENIEYDFFTVYSNIIVFDIKWFNPIAILFVIIPALINPIKILKYKLINYYGTRKEYKNFLALLLKESYKYLWILPLIALIFMIPVMFYSTFDLTYQEINGFTFWSTNLLYHPAIFIFLYLFNMMVYSLFFINLGLIISRKINKYFTSIVVTFLSYIGIQLFFELVINKYILVNIFHTEIGYLFNIMNMFIFSDQFGITPLILFSLVMLVISFVLLYFSYNNKEKLFIDCNKNYKESLWK